MPQHTAVRFIDGEWSVTSLDGTRVLATFPSEHAAQRAVADDMTPAERARAFGDLKHAEARSASYEAALLHRLDAGLPLSRVDARTARRLRAANRVLTS